MVVASEGLVCYDLSLWVVEIHVGFISVFNLEVGIPQLWHPYQ